MLAELTLRVLLRRMQVDESIEVFHLFEKPLVLFTGCERGYVMEMKKLSSCCSGSSFPLDTYS
jgi:hypothetical protein